jgi:hypothetical protein
MLPFALIITFWGLMKLLDLAQKFNRRTALESTTKLSYEALFSPLRKINVECCPSILPSVFQ